MCQFVEDIYEVVDLLRERSDMNILEERDYISNVKPSGYRSYHIVIEYPVQLITGEKKIFLWVRNNFSTLVSQALNTVLYNVAAFWGIYDTDTLISICVGGYVVFIVTSIMDTPAIYIARKIQPKIRISI